MCNSLPNKFNNWRRRLIWSLSAGVILASSAAMADDVTVPASGHWEITDVELINGTVHADDDPFKGAVILNLWNNSNVAWGELYLQLFKPSGSGIDLMNVIFVDGTHTPGWDPSAFPPRPSLTWNITPPDPVEQIGSIMQLFFYDDPVEIGQTAQFTVYTDNTGNSGVSNNLVGLMFYPVAVPEPSGLALAAVAAAALLRRRRES